MKSKKGMSGGGGAKSGPRPGKRSGRGSYESEGGRMSSSEMNAEVEKGHNDLRKLKKENETLKQQVWTLRDEYDKLETLVKGMDSSGSSSSFDDDESLTCCSGSYHRRCSIISNLTVDDVDLYQDLDNDRRHCGCSSKPISGKPVINDARSCPSSIGRPIERPSEPYIESQEHFNLDQLLDFASSFRYDRRKHLTNDPIGSTLPDSSNSCKNQLKYNDARSSSQFPSVRRRSATVIEHITEGAPTGAAIIEEMKNTSDGNLIGSPVKISSYDIASQTTTVTYARPSFNIFSNSLDGSRSQSLGTGLNCAEGIENIGSPIDNLNNSPSLKSCSSSLDTGLPIISVYPPQTPLIRLSNIEPNTIMISVSEKPHLWDISTQEIIDELEQQIGPSLPDIHGVRVVGRAAYISLGRREPLEQILIRGLTIRGNSVSLIDVTRESVVVGLTGVPHYIADGTLFILLATFGTIIGEIERRFYKGVDTGERFVRMKLKKFVKLPKYVTVGGCKIILTVHDRLGSMASQWAHLNLPPPHLQAARRSQSPPVSPNIPLTNQPKCSDDINDTISKGCSISEESFLAAVPKSFTSKCVVNLKIPDKNTISGAIPKLFRREAPPPPQPNIFSKSSLSPGHVLRVGSLDRNQQVITSIPLSPLSISLSPVSPRMKQDFTEQNNVQLENTSLSIASTKPSIILPQIMKKPIISFRKPDTASSSRPKQNSVVFEEPGKEKTKVKPPVPRGNQAANGILRRTSVTQEQESLIPQRQTATATIKSRLRLGGPRLGVNRGRGQSNSRQLGRMASISENTISEDVNDIAPIGSRSRRDSERSSLSGLSKSSSNQKTRRDVIDLPWCGCWGNGCI